MDISSCIEIVKLLVNSAELDQTAHLEGLLKHVYQCRPVVQNVDSLTRSLRGQLVKCYMTLQTNILILYYTVSFT